MPLDTKTKIVVVGHGDVMEAALRRYFTGQGFTRLVAVGAFNPLSAVNTLSFFERESPEMVILTSLRSGGIGINQAQPAQFIHENLLSQVNVIDAAYRTGVKKLLFVAASCIYPKDADVPIKEESFLTQPMETTSLPYSMAKAAGVVMCQAYRRQYGFNAIVAVPSTVYGPGTGTDVREEHVLGALIHKFTRARNTGEKAVELWGSGAPLREFLFADDFAAACHFLLEHYEDEAMINVPGGEAVSIEALAGMIKDAVGFKGGIDWDRSRSDGAMRKVLDGSRLKAMGWSPQTGLLEGIRRTCAALDPDISLNNPSGRYDGKG
jgi:GDP-L-fucose synthase